MNRRKALLAGVLAVGALTLVVSAFGSAAGLLDIYNFGDLHEGISQGHPGRPGSGESLQAGAVYEASAFPIALRVRPPDGRWGGVQFESGRFRFLQLGHARTGNVPFHGAGDITLEAGTGSTGSVARAVARLRATPHISLGATTPTRVAGFAGEAFDATIVGSDRRTGRRYCNIHTCPHGVSLVPFTVNHHCFYCGDRTVSLKIETQDVKYAAEGELFHIIVIDVRGKTVVIYLEPTYSVNKGRFRYTKTFPTFVPYARQMLATLRFPANT
jgi:hypothetical protein